ncbi:MAG: hypothetical protein Q8S18_00435 [Bacteroidales bacterium]|nr:hypothetical protein [Bacteroidales bacterium]
MELLMEVLNMLLPALLVGLVAFLMMKSLLKSNRDHLALVLEQFRLEQQRQAHERKLNAQKLLTPIRLQAFERLVLFLERIQPSGLVTRLMNNTMSLQQLQLMLVRTVREEFEHNLSQQLYVSGTAWQMVKAAKEEVIQLINKVAAEHQPDASSAELAREVVLGRVRMIDEAIARLKEEISEFS